MARINVKTEVQAPDEIVINLVREDFLDTSNTFRIFFEISLAITSAILGGIISLINDNKDVPFMNWFFFGSMSIGSIAFLIISIRHYNKAKKQSKEE